ncbi:MAG: right-handed parallel beta-helix repeat-containing protein [Phycisphaerales bacterium]|nr:right-handed parallel beta-helix repeat-containing protein [Phycisphaerales bacterium]
MSFPAILVMSLFAVPADPVKVVVSADDTVITQSCRVEIAAGAVIEDANGNGVIQIKADGVVVEFVEGSDLRGAGPAVPWNQLRGVGMRVEGVKNVTIRNARIHGFKVGLQAVNADGLVIEGGDFSDNFRQRLKSTARAEDASDWLWPHDNDKGEWLDRYGAAVALQSTSGATVRGITVRRGQNGIVLDRVNDSKVFDNDCSFLSGWGLAMWRSSRNVICRNALDFCVRGYSHGVYNRGQDSAGILMFEQCSGNVIAENSVTHGGDGFFGFGGKEALGDSPAPEGFDYTRKGCNDNLLIDNDFSFAPAHGVEMTFGFGNKLFRNRIVDNAICGFWGGYSQDTVIALNQFTGNGRQGYRLERGGVNIEHGTRNRIQDNTFKDNACGVHLWFDDDKDLLQKPWAKANHKGSIDNLVANNTFTGDQLVLQLRESKQTVYVGNKAEGVGREIDATPGSEPTPAGDVPSYQVPQFPVLGDRRPVGARAGLAGRDKIIMGEWGPWDHQSPLVRLAAATPDGFAYEVFGAADGVEAIEASGGIRVNVEAGQGGGPALVKVGADPGVTPYSLRIKGKGFDEKVAGTIIAASWNVRVFPWTNEPRENLAGWRAEAQGPTSLAVELPALQLKYGGGGPKELGLSEAIKNSPIGPDRFGTVATTKIRLPKGKWRIQTVSDDGVRVVVNGATVIEDWNWHAPKTDVGIVEMPQDGEADILVEHFELDGYAILTLDIEKAD